MAVTEDSLKFYLTSSEPLVAQTNLSESIGGYPSTTEINPSVVLNDYINRFQTNIPFTGNIDATPSYINIEHEIMSVSSIANNEFTVNRGQLGTAYTAHSKFDAAFNHKRIFLVNNNNLFNNSFNSNYKQYRCIAIKNTGTDTFFNLCFYIKYNSLNTNSGIKIALEVPKYGQYNGNTASGTTISLVDTSLINHPDDFENRVLTFLSGDNINVARKIASFDADSGTLTFTNAFPYPISAAQSFRVDCSPAQRIQSGSMMPTTGTIYVSNFSTATNYVNSININYENTRINGSNLLPNDVVYVWFERSLINNKPKYLNNRIIFTAAYTSELAEGFSKPAR